MPIRPLPPLVVSQIAAGEVVERPASVVKELVENAIDAGATRIAIEIEDGGKALVRVSDDGAGIAADELALAVAPHATSKIAAVADLDHVATMGFRGEALASIASVSRLTLLSRAAGAEDAWQLESEGGAMGAPRPAAAPPGTTVTVRNLFFNTPARRKFLRAEQTETGRIVDVVQALALAHPAIGFELTVGARRRLGLGPASPRARAIEVLGPELEPELLEFDAAAEGLRIWGLAGAPALAGVNARGQRAYVNGRPITDRTVTHAIREGYRGLIEPGFTPVMVIFLEMDPALVDVNVHPAKSEVRFREQAAVHAAIMRAVRERLRAADLTPPVALESAAGASVGAAADVRGGAREIVERIRGLAPAEKGFVYAELKEALAALPADAPPGAVPPLPVVRPVVDALQVHRAYLVTEDEAGLLIVDQHALHERVMFEELEARLERGPLESQRLLVPAMIRADGAAIERLDALRPMLERLGIDATAAGPDAVAVHAFTTLLLDRGVDPVVFMEDVLARMGELGGGAEAILHEVVDMMACKAAIKAGQRLAPPEIETLLAARGRVERSSRCPHGRPTTLRIGLKELERRFGRR
jgi:DNA mismatch repair protein MutL